jgi:4-alpha-glucanotransferase
MVGPAVSWAIEDSYVDARGNLRTADPATIAAITACLSSRSDGSERRDIIAFRQGAAFDIALPPEDFAEFGWEVSDERGCVAFGHGRDATVRIPDENLAIGRYTLSLGADSGARRSFPVLVAPPTAYQPAFGGGHRQAWLLAVQLYAIRSDHNWGHGDFTDLKFLIDVAAKIGAAGVGINPLHALPSGQASPYSPSSRLFLNPLYIDVDAVAEFPGLAACGLLDEVAVLRDAELIDYDKIIAVKSKALASAYRVFRRHSDSRRRDDFEAFRAERGLMLTRFAAFEVLKQRFGAVWREWPSIWRQPSDAALSKLRQTADEEMTYQEYIQWLADRQLSACQTAARDLNLPLGLYLDLAVGVEAGGADAWSAQDALTHGLSIGAPPDMFNPRGQNWGLVAFHPQALADSNFLFFRQTLAATMRHAGAVRIDHALGLNRLYLIPNGQDAERGAYVRLPFEAMLAVVSQESERSRCLVIGEDLGTVPPGVSETLQAWGVWSYLVAMFERGADGEFRKPEQYAENAIVTFGTHDLPTLAGWIKGHDLSLRNTIGLATGENARDRDAAYQNLLSALERHGIHVGGDGAFIAVMRYLARSRSRLMSVALEDVIGLEDQTNVPGTVAEHPNWRRRLPIDLKEFCALGGFEPIASAMAKEGRGIHP